jgi:hypothetical protein
MLAACKCSASRWTSSSEFRASPSLKLNILTASSQNSDVYLGVITWAAGGFDQSYALTQTPSVNGNVLTDQALVTQCVVNKIGSGNATAPYTGPPLF